MELMEQKELETIYVAAPKNFHSNRQSEEELKRRMFGNYPIKKCFITDNTKFSFLSGFPHFEEVSDFFEKNRNSFKKETEILETFSDNSNDELDLINFCRNSESLGRGFYLMRLRSEYQQGILNILKKDGWPHKLISLEKSSFAEENKNKSYIENLHHLYQSYSDSVLQIQTRNKGKIAKRGTEDGELRHQYFLMMKEIENLEKGLSRNIQ